MRFFIVRDQHDSVVCFEYVCTSKDRATKKLRERVADVRAGGAGVVYDVRRKVYEYDWHKVSYCGEIRIVEVEGDERD